MKKILVGLMMLFAVSACTLTPKPQIIIRTVHTVVIPDEAMYNCPVMRRYPNFKTLTDGQIAKLLVELDNNNRTCRASLDAIKKYLEESKRKIESGNKNS
ncbi:hypothetical protein phiOC_p408 [Ochrobactrum phage vB_OspM_OC]|nr:hypothetical protein phiOC_p408 [Ochrobactrum phage vB_OspM_OC]